MKKIRVNRIKKKKKNVYLNLFCPKKRRVCIPELQKTFTKQFSKIYSFRLSFLKEEGDPTSGF